MSTFKQRNGVKGYISGHSGDREKLDDGNNRFSTITQDGDVGGKSGVGHHPHFTPISLDLPLHNYTKFGVLIPTLYLCLLLKSRSRLNFQPLITQDNTRSLTPVKGTPCRSRPDFRVGIKGSRCGSVGLSQGEALKARVAGDG